MVQQDSMIQYGTARQHDTLWYSKKAGCNMTQHSVTDDITQHSIITMTPWHSLLRCKSAQRLQWWKLNAGWGWGWGWVWRRDVVAVSSLDRTFTQSGSTAELTLLSVGDTLVGNILHMPNITTHNRHRGIIGDILQMWNQNRYHWTPQKWLSRSAGSLSDGSLPTTCCLPSVTVRDLFRMVGCQRSVVFPRSQCGISFGW